MEVIGKLCAIVHTINSLRQGTVIKLSHFCRYELKETFPLILIIIATTVQP